MKTRNAVGNSNEISMFTVSRRFICMHVAPLSTVYMHTQSQYPPTSSTSSLKLSSSRSRVKEVPDFGKLHKHFQQQLEKVSSWVPRPSLLLFPMYFPFYSLFAEWNGFVGMARCDSPIFLSFQKKQKNRMPTQVSYCSLTSHYAYTWHALWISWKRILPIQLC